MAGIFLLFLVLGGVVLQPLTPAYAQFAVQNVTTFDYPRWESEGRQEAKFSLTEAVLQAAIGTAYNTASYFLKKLAYDTAKFLGESAAGKKSLVFEKPAGDYIADVAGGAVGEAIVSIGQPFGLNLCQIPDIRLQLFLQIGIGDLYGQGSPTPRCTLQEFRNNWSAEGFERKFGKGASKLIPQKFSDAVSVKQSDFGLAFGAIAQVDAIRATAAASAGLERTIGNGFRDLKDKVSDTILTPARFFEQAATKNIASDNFVTGGFQLLGGAIASGAAQAIPLAVQTFLGSFVTTLLDQTFEQGLFQPNAFDPNFFAVGNRNREPAGVLSDLLTAQVVSVPSYDVLLNFVTCPKNPKLDNCVMDQSLFQALTRGTLDKPMTIREAMNAGLLHGDWPLISPRREVAGGNGNRDSECYSNAYCYSNIQKLRKARILPLGFEIAALKADPDSPQENWTLQRVVDNFENCAPDGRASAQFPYCHLINPNWVLRSFSASCPARVVGPNLVTPASPTRGEECADIATCIATNSDGSCMGQGFCTKEKNIWKLNGDVCAPQYATCRTYRNSTGEVDSYLTRTIDFSTCTADTVGCRAFSTEQNAQGQWIPTAQANLALKTVTLGRNQALFVNQIGTEKTCPTGAEGCHAFFTALRVVESGQFSQTAGGQYIQAPVSEIAYLKKAPDYLGCYDTNIATPEVNWPRTSAEAQTVFARNNACGKFAAACAPQEVGCESYRPLGGAGAPAIPGMVGGNTCNQICVGYDTFRQEATAFDPAVFPLHFIPSAGDRCQERFAGCSEFTNIDVAARGGEGREYYTDLRRCERPQVNPGQTYYSWEGSDREGYVLRVHTLVALDVQNSAYMVSAATAAGTVQGVNYNTIFAVGSPTYANDNGEALQNAVTRCNEVNYTLGVNDPVNPNRADIDCRALYDANGEVYYRLLSETIAVSAECSRLRKTDSSLYVDAVLTNSAACTGRGGSWDVAENECRRCAAGGRVENGACVYQALTTAGQSSACPALANNCRVYVGNTGRNVFATVINDNFEDTQAPLALGWAPVQNNAALRLAGEAVIVGEHSLGIPAAAARVARTVPQAQVQVGKTFTLTFWGRADGLQNLEIYFTQNGSRVNANGVEFGAFTEPTALAGITGGWQEFTFGPVSLDGVDPAEPLAIEFVRSGNARDYFLDYVRLIELRDRTPLIRNSWRVAGGGDVPTQCDSTPTDIFPGEALGCRAYTDSKNRVVYATGFETICREAAVGCEPVWDTQNTLGAAPASTFAQAFNVWCSAPGSANCTARVANVDYECTVPRGQEGCYINEAIIIPTGTVFPVGPLRVVNTSVVIPADTAVAAPLFLTNRKDVTCRSTELGCQKVAMETQVLPRADAAAFTFNEVYLLNNPANYVTAPGESAGILCQAEQIGCAEFRSDNTVSYFRDPEFTGAGVCEYLEGQSVGQTRVNGWFLRGMGRCSQDATMVCRTNNNSDCGAGNTCVASAVACDATFLRRTSSGVVYDVRSNDSPEYTGRVAVCAAEAHLCTEFIDPVDVSGAYPNGRPYYVKNNDKIRARAQACATGASQVDGCILFDQTDNPRKTYSTDATYRASALASPEFSPVSPRSAGSVTDNDANIVLKVDRDRVCAEWLACKGKVIQEDEQGRQSELCYDYKACDQMGAGGVCTHWVGELAPEASRQLTEDLYIQRGLGWNDPEYSGYSLFNQYQIGNQSYIVLDLSADKVAINPQSPDAAADLRRLERLEERAYAVYLQRSANSACAPVGNERTDWRVCGSGGLGRCYSGQCIRPVKGTFPSDRTIPSGNISPREIESLVSVLEAASCKAYPEATSPYPQSVLKQETTARNILGALGISAPRVEFISKLNEFAGANVCQTGEDCSCKYVKVTYRNGVVDYWPYLYESANAAAPIPTRVCATGPNQGRPCSAIEQCNVATPNQPQTNQTPHECIPIQKRDTYYGFEGFCLERDLSRPVNGINSPTEYACLTWLPIGVSASTFDIFNADDEAGYKPDIDALLLRNTPQIAGQAYCVNSTRLGVGLQAPDISPPVGGGTDNAIRTVADGNTVYDQVFPAGQDPTNGGDCSTDTEFERIMCNSVDQGYIYSAIQSWAWRRFGPSALLLRTEMSSLNGSNDPNTYDTVRASDLQVYTPSVFANNVHDDLVLSNQTDAEVAAFGTLLHPPRQFGVTPPGDTTNVFMYRDRMNNFSVNTSYLGVPDPAPNPNTPDGQYNLGMTPDRLDTFNQSNSQLERSIQSGHFRVMQRAETAFMRSSDLSRVTFVPLAFPGGLEGYAPQILNDGFFLDVAALRSRAHNDPIITSGRQTSFGGAGSQGDYYAEPAGGGNNGVVVNVRYVRPEAEGAEFDSLDYTDLTGGSGWLFNQYNQECGTTSVRPQFEEWCRRNRIQERYVSIFFVDRGQGNTSGGGSRFPSFVLNQELDTSVSSFAGRNQAPISDPFSDSVLCKTDSNADGDGDTENWVAIGMDFNEDGEFLGFVSRWCNESVLQATDVSDGIYFATIAQMADQCTAVAQVHDSSAPLTEQLNKAWTNRVWQYATNAVSSVSNAIRSMTHPSFGSVFTKDGMRNSPFGSLRITNFGTSDEQAEILRRYGFQSGMHGEDLVDGVPYACSGASWFGSLYLTGNTAHPCSTLESRALVSPLIPAQVAVLGQNQTAGENALSRLFALTFDTFSLENASVRPNVQTSRTTIDPLVQAVDRSGVSNPVPEIGTLVAPQIYSLNPANCPGGGTVGEQSRSKCGLGEPNNMTINGQNSTMRNYDRSQDGSSDEDLDRSGAPDPRGLIGIGNLQVNMKFFAAADDNKMPIRQVRVNWGDNSPIVNENQTGLYKNRKPYCSSADNAIVTIGLCGTTATDLSLFTCRTHADCPTTDPRNAQTNYRCYGPAANTDQDRSDSYQFARFGNSPRACLARPFNFVKDYTCTVEDVNPNSPAAFTVRVGDIQNPDARVRLSAEYGLGENERVCVFRPRVQVKDNWGWCNGVENGVQSVQGFHDGSDTQSIVDDICDDLSDNNPRNVWTRYQGEIIVIPLRPSQE